MMGRRGEDGEEGGGGRAVKREVVSASANLEVISPENFARRLHGMAACLNCHKERYYGTPTPSHGRHGAPRLHPHHHHHHPNTTPSINNSSSKAGRRSKQGRRKPTKANSPIVIHLKDTLRSALQQRQRSLDTDSDVSVRSTDDDLGQDTFGDVSSIPEFIPQYLHPQPQPSSHPHLHHHHHHTPSLTQPATSSSSLSQRREKSKNLTALISVIEKAHLKDSCSHMESNLAHGVGRSKLPPVLNNALSLCADKNLQQQRSIGECDNVEVICNDLHNKAADKGGEAGGEDTDSVSDKSSVASSSEVLSDSDSQLVEESPGLELTAEELQRLAEYTTGYPLYRYDPHPHSYCPDCLAAWYPLPHQVYQYDGCSFDIAATPRDRPAPAGSYGRGRARSGSHHNDSERDTALNLSDNDEGAEDGYPPSRRGLPPGGRRRHLSSSSSSCSQGAPPKSAPSSPTSTTTTSNNNNSGGGRQPEWPWQKGLRQLWDIDISPSARRAEASEARENAYPNSVYVDLTGSEVAVSVYYHHSLMQDQAARGAVAASMLTPALYPASPQSLCYSSSYLGSPVYGVALPLSFFNDNALPTIAMVPPHELKMFNTSTPPQRKWLPVAGNQDRTHPAARFTVMCYNVLCDKYCTRQQYGYCPSWALNWEYRKKGILEHIIGLNADIISLQEVETEQFGRFFLPQLQQVGYDGIFSPKSRARTMTEQERRHVDGCAIFFKKDKFRLVEEKLVEFNQLAMANAEGNDDMLNRVMTKDNIGLCALLETKAPIFENCPPPPEPVSRQLLLVATAHIHWDPEFSDVKLVQTMMLMWELQQLVEDATRKYALPFPGPYTCNSIPFVFCGDLNSLPDSGVIEFLCNGKVPVNHGDFKDNVYDQAMKKMCNGDKTHIHHNFHLSRAYSDIMPVTNYTYDFKGIIDYIFHSRDRLKVLGHLGPYDEDWFRHNKIIGCPHPHIPSDHFSLLVEFELPIHPPVLGRALPPLPNKNR